MGIEKQRHLVAYSIFEYLSANNWYLLQDDSLTIEFYDNNIKLKHLPNLHQKRISEKFLSEEVSIEDIGNNLFECKINYFWSKKYGGNVFCNNMLIPSKYKFESCLAKVFKVLPTILVDEGKKQRLEIDLARENCKLTIDGINYEERILKEVLCKCLQNFKECGQYLENVSWIYFINQEGEMKKVIKSNFWISNHPKMEYCLVYIDFADCEEKVEERKLEIVKELVEEYGTNIAVEFIDDCLHIDTPLNRAQFNDLYIAAKYKIKLILNQREYERIMNFLQNI